MSLEEYDKKRNFTKTSEPKSDNDESSRDYITKIFVVQEHYASHHHWDFRLEIDDVLKSWAVPKVPPTEKGVRRLAIEVEDHPMEYASFEGTIPEGEYGAGTVSIWDKGSFVLEERREHKLTFELKGKKMIGKYILIKVPNMGKNSWLFFKSY